MTQAQPKKTNSQLNMISATSTKSNSTNEDGSGAAETFALPDDTQPPAISEGSDYARKLSNIIEKSLLTDKMPPYTPKDQRKAVAAWFEIFRDEGIPPAGINLCYLAAKRVIRKLIHEKGTDFLPKITADFVAAQWQSVRAELDAKNKTKRLSSGKVIGCPDCFGTNYKHERIRDQYRITAEKCTHSNYVPSEENEL